MPNAWFKTGQNNISGYKQTDFIPAVSGHRLTLSTNAQGELFYDATFVDPNDGEEGFLNPNGNIARSSAQTVTDAATIPANNSVFYVGLKGNRPQLVFEASVFGSTTTPGGGATTTSNGGSDNTRCEVRFVNQGTGAPANEFLKENRALFEGVCEFIQNGVNSTGVDCWQMHPAGSPVGPIMVRRPNGNIEMTNRNAPDAQGRQTSRPTTVLLTGVNFGDIVTFSVLFENDNTLRVTIKKNGEKPVNHTITMDPNWGNTGFHFTAGAYHATAIFKSKDYLDGKVVNGLLAPEDSTDKLSVAYRKIRITLQNN